MKKFWIFASITLVGVGMGVGIYFWYSGSNAIDLDNFNPDPYSNEGRALEALTQQSATPAYDLEKTVVAMHALDLAQAESSSFDDFLIKMATEIDLEGVAPEVLEAKARMLPILAEMKSLSQQYEELGNSWQIFVNAMGAASTNVVGNEESKDVVTGAFTGGPLNPFTNTASATVNVASEGMNTAINTYQEQMNLKRSLRKELSRLKEAYAQYLEEYMPVYSKYMKEWDNMCVDKDFIYLNISEGHWEQAAKDAHRFLEKYPDNREGLLLEAMSLAYIGANNNRKDRARIDVDVQNTDHLTLSSGDNAWLQAADTDIDRYLELYKDKQSAPASVIKANIEMARGNLSQANMYLRNASIEYPRQREALTSMRDIYNLRKYMKDSDDGQKLLLMYYSMMYGFDVFSPELQRAAVSEIAGKYDDASNLIYNHFNRRLSRSESSNEEPFYGILTDLEYCETNLPVSYGLQRLNPAFVSLEYDNDIETSIFDSKEEKEKKRHRIRVIFRKNDETDLTNVNVYLCYQFAGSHKDYYRVAHDPIQLGSTVGLSEWPVEVDLPDNKTFDDISRVRAVVYTDQGICWVDSEGKRRSILRDQLNNPNGNVLVQNNPITPAYGQFLEDHNLDKKSVLRLLREKTTVQVNIDKDGLMDKINKGVMSLIGGETETRKDRHVVVDLPKELALLRPIFSVGELNRDGAITPATTYESGNVRVRFDVKNDAPDSVVVELYLYSEYGNYVAKISINATRGSIVSCKEL